MDKLCPLSIKFTGFELTDSQFPRKVHPNQHLQVNLMRSGESNFIFFFQKERKSSSSNRNQNPESNWITIQESRLAMDASTWFLDLINKL